MLRLAIRVRAADAELVLAELLELAPGGVEQVDLAEGVVEYAVYGPPGELPELPDLRAAAGGALVEVSTSEVADDWAERWREFHRPLVLGDRLAVRPPWEGPVFGGPGARGAGAGGAGAGGAGVELVIDPGQAFGTGAHATTRLCLELMLSLDPGGAFLDLGCGSGVLAIAAARLGWDPVMAVDNDPAAVAATAANARVNGVVVEVGRADVRSDPAAVPAARTVAANLLAPLLLGLAPVVPVTPGGALIASGALVGEADSVAAAFASRGLREVDRRVRGEWVALLLRG